MILIIGIHLDYGLIIPVTIHIIVLFTQHIIQIIIMGITDIMAAYTVDILLLSQGRMIHID